MKALETIKTLIQVKRNFLEAMATRHSSNKEVYNLIQGRIQALNEVITMIDDIEGFELNLDELHLSEIPSHFPTTPV